VAALVREAGAEREAELITGILVTGLRLARDGASRLDLKIVNSAIREMRDAFKVFAAYRGIRKVSVFGSARTRPGDADYEQARRFGEQIARAGWMVVTGAGPGSMEAANAGAGAAASFGVNIRLPFEAEPNPFIAEDPKLIHFKYFFTRKLTFIKEADAFVLLPGGFGTMDEAFEILTLLQTGKHEVNPIVLLDAPGGEYWEKWRHFAEDALVKPGYVSADDLNIFRVTDDVDTAVSELRTFYSNFHSMRFVGKRLVLRVARAPDAVQLAELEREFSDIVLDGGMRLVPASRSERTDGDALDKERISFVFDRYHYGRLRELIDRLNAMEISPPAAAPLVP
jgi:hypothetical protein